MNGKTIGKRYTPGELVDILLKDEVFYDQSKGGVTFSGGEPLEQPDFLYEVLKQCRANGIHAAVDTSGYAERQTFERIKPVTDLFLYDLKLMDPELHFHYTSVDNKKIIDNLAFLLGSGCKVIVRIPLIPDITSKPENLEKILTVLSASAEPPEINLLPYHRTAEGKYERLGMINRMKGVRTLSEKEIRRSLEIFESSGYPAKLG